MAEVTGGATPLAPGKPPAGTLLSLPPLEGLRFFEAAARHESFKHAAAELGVTPAAVGYRIRALEQHLDAELFDRHQRGVNLNRHGRAYLEDVKRILAEVHNATERHRRRPRRVRVVSVEAVAERWLTPRLAALEAAHPGVAIELETDHRGVDVGRRDFDAWIAYTGETAAPRPISQPRGRPARGNPLPRAAPRRLQPRPARRARPPQNPRRAARVAATVRPRLGQRLGLLGLPTEPGQPPTSPGPPGSASTAS